MEYFKRTQLILLSIFCVLFSPSFLFAGYGCESEFQNYLSSPDYTFNFQGYITCNYWNNCPIDGALAWGPTCTSTGSIQSEDPNSDSVIWKRVCGNSVNYVIYCAPLSDIDSDSIPDAYDLKPNSNESYNAAIVSVCYDSNNNIVAGIIQDSEGNQYKFGNIPENMEGYTIESVSGNQINYQTGESLADSLSKLDISDFQLNKIDGSGVEVQDDGTIIPGASGPLDDWLDKEENQINAPTPDTQDTPSNTPQTGDTDSIHLQNIVSNTNSTNKNLENIAGYLGITNNLLAKINNKTGTQSSVGSSGGSTTVNIETPTADEIGQSVKDQLIDASQTIDPSTTDNITSVDKSDTLTSISTKYSDRYNLFIDTVKGSDLFSLPFGIFTGPSGSGSSIQTISIGKWGSSTDQTVSIDYSDYDNVWEILRSVVLLITSFTCFKILILKKA